jgi:enoyl-CoA hydratase/carnithine racemase
MDIPSFVSPPPAFLCQFIAHHQRFEQGGGTELLLNCDIIIGCENAIICLPEVRRGVVASVGGPSPLLHFPLDSWLD